MEQVQMQTIEMGRAVEAKPARRWLSRPIRLAAMWGTVSVAIYFLMFENQGNITEYFTRGGVYSVAIIAVALGVTLVYSTFANYVLEILGIQPSKRKDH